MISQYMWIGKLEGDCCWASCDTQNAQHLCDCSKEGTDGFVLLRANVTTSCKRQNAWHGVWVSWLNSMKGTVVELRVMLRMPNMCVIGACVETDGFVLLRANVATSCKRQNETPHMFCTTLYNCVEFYEFLCTCIKYWEGVILATISYWEDVLLSL